MKPGFQFNHPNSNPHVQPSLHQQPSQVQGHYKSQLRPLGSHVLSPSVLPQLCSSTDISWWEWPQHPFYGRLCGWRYAINMSPLWRIAHTCIGPSLTAPKLHILEDCAGWWWTIHWSPRWCIVPVSPVKKSSTLSGKLCSLMDIYHQLTCLALRHLAIVSGSWGPLRHNFCRWTSQTKTLQSTWHCIQCCQWYNTVSWHIALYCKKKGILMDVANSFARRLPLCS